MSLLVPSPLVSLAPGGYPLILAAVALSPCAPPSISPCAAAAAGGIGIGSRSPSSSAERRPGREHRCADGGHTHVVDGGGDGDGAEESGRILTASASLHLPFPAGTAFDAWTDLPRQPSWSAWLRSVEYVNGVGGEPAGTMTEGSTRERKLPLFLSRRSRWTAHLFGIRYSWTAEVTECVPGVSFGWRSTSGVRTFGRISFEPVEDRVESGRDQGCRQCRAILTMSVLAPRAIVTVFRHSGALKGFFRNRILLGTLLKFRDVVLQEERQGGGGSNQKNATPIAEP